MKITYVATGILIDTNNNILLEKNNTTTNFSNYWQFAGGKLEINETPLMALKREIYEELNITLDNEFISTFGFVESNLDENKYFVVFFYLCKKWQGEIIPKVNQELKWCKIEDLHTLKLLPNNFTIIEKLKQLKL